MNRLLFLATIGVLLCTYGCKAPRTEVVLCSTIHGAHEENPKYSYEDLFAFVDDYNPDVIGVEIREEDIDSSIEYLDRNYPYEMFHCIDRYSDKMVLGFDWLGDELEGRAIPNDYWRDVSELKKLQGDLAVDSVVLQTLVLSDSLRQQKVALFMSESLQGLNDGRYDTLNELYYAELDKQLAGTRYQALSDFYNKRDSMIAANIIHIIKEHPEKRLVFLVGADHRSHVLRRIEAAFGKTILLNGPFAN